MLSDRPYMNENYPRERTSAHIWLIAIIGAAFVLELVLLSPWWPAGQKLVSDLVLTTTSLRAGHLWTPLSHALIHDNSNPFHILFIACSLYFLGRELTPVLGSKRLLVVFFTSLLTGALVWTAVHWVNGGAHFGATAGVLGLFVVLAGVYPDHQLSFLLVPVALRPKHLIFGLLFLDLFGLVLYEILGSPAPFGLAPSAHLGGMLAGWVYYRFFHSHDGWDRASFSLFKMPAWLRRRSQAKAPTPGVKFNLNQRSGLRSEVDRILDKINSQGFGSLTHEEKRLLDEAKDLLSRH